MAGPHVMIATARFYADIAAALEEGAAKALREAAATWHVVPVPGALEIPAAIAFADAAGAAGRIRRFDGYVALGCVIRGETTHYDTVCWESARGLTDLALGRGLAVGNGILTCEDDAQAWERARPDRKDKGGGAARACLDMIALRRQFGL